MAARSPVSGRLAELLADESVAALTAEERAELDGLLAAAPAARQAAARDELMHAAGLAQLAFLRRDQAARRAMPAATRQRLRQQAAAWAAGRAAGPAAPTVTPIAAARLRRAAPGAPAPAATPARSGRFASLGWFAAAALALAFVLGRQAPLPLVPAVERAALLQREPGLLRATWAPSAAPGFEQAGGDVVWSRARQEGYLRLVGLPPNDPARHQYQLWVVDPERDTRPVDGGVFDVDTSGEVVIPIHAKLRVDHPTAFAITLEQPGGVVVSGGPLLLVAAVGG